MDASHLEDEESKQQMLTSDCVVLAYKPTDSGTLEALTAAWGIISATENKNDDEDVDLGATHESNQPTSLDHVDCSMAPADSNNPGLKENQVKIFVGDVSDVETGDGSTVPSLVEVKTLFVERICSSV